MTKASDITATCCQCGKQFVFTQREQKLYERKGLTFPSLCPQCRSEKQAKPRRLICSQCGTELNKDQSVYCTACFTAIQLNFEKQAEECQKAVDELQSKLLTIESQKAEFAGLFNQGAQLAVELEQKVVILSQELEKIHQSYAAPQWFQPALSHIEKRLEALEQGQHEK